MIALIHVMRLLETLADRCYEVLSTICDIRVAKGRVAPEQGQQREGRVDRQGQQQDTQRKHDLQAHNRTLARLVVFHIFEEL